MKWQVEGPWFDLRCLLSSDHEAIERFGEVFPLKTSSFRMNAMIKQWIPMLPQQVQVPGVLIFLFFLYLVSTAPST